MEAPWAALERFGGTVGSFGGSWDALWSSWGALWELLGGLWELPRVILGAFWDDFGVVFPSTTRYVLFFFLCSYCNIFSYFLHAFCKFFNMAEVLPARAGSSGSDLGHSLGFSVFVSLFILVFFTFAT